MLTCTVLTELSVIPDASFSTILWLSDQHKSNLKISPTSARSLFENNFTNAFHKCFNNAANFILLLTRKLRSVVIIYHLSLPSAFTLSNMWRALISFEQTKKDVDSIKMFHTSLNTFKSYFPLFVSRTLPFLHFVKFNRENHFQTNWTNSNQIDKMSLYFIYLCRLLLAQLI